MALTLVPSLLFFSSSLFSCVSACVLCLLLVHVCFLQYLINCSTETEGQAATETGMTTLQLLVSWDLWCVVVCCDLCFLMSLYIIITVHACTCAHACKAMICTCRCVYTCTCTSSSVRKGCAAYERPHPVHPVDEPLPSSHPHSSPLSQEGRGTSLRWRLLSERLPEAIERVRSYIILCMSCYRSYICI